MVVSILCIVEKLVTTNLRSIDELISQALGYGLDIAERCLTSTCRENRVVRRAHTHTHTHTHTSLIPRLSDLFNAREKRGRARYAKSRAPRLGAKGGEG